MGILNLNCILIIYYHFKHDLADDEEISTDEELSKFKLFNKNRYKVKKLLGEGAYGKVYAVFDTNQKNKYFKLFFFSFRGCFKHFMKIKVKR